MAHSPLTTDASRNAWQRWLARGARVASLLGAMFALVALPACVGGPHPLPPEGNNAGGTSGKGGSAGTGDVSGLDAGSVGAAGTSATAGTSGGGAAGGGNTADAGGCVVSPDAGISDDASCLPNDDDAGALAP